MDLGDHGVPGGWSPGTDLVLPPQTGAVEVKGLLAPKALLSFLCLHHYSFILKSVDLKLIHCISMSTTL